MAKTAFATDNALTKKLWDEKLFRDTVKEAYFKKFMGEGSDNLIMEKTDLEKSKGDNITFGLRMRLAGQGVISGQQLENNEEKLTTHNDSVSLEQYRHGVRDDGALTRQRAMFDISAESMTALKDWGSEKIDQNIFDALITTTPSIVFYQISGTITKQTTYATAKSAITVAANSLLTPKLISFAKAYAKTGGGRSGMLTPLRPIKVEGRAYYVLLVHPDVMFDLKQDTTFTQALREAEIRGPQNPLFQGATAIWDGVVIHEHENVPVGTNAGAGAIPYCDGIFMGAQAGLYAWGKRPEVVTETFDYKNEIGYGWGMIAKAKKPVFNSKDYGSFQLMLSRTNVAGA